MVIPTSLGDGRRADASQTSSDSGLALPPDARRIGLWGGSRSGKSTILAMMEVAGLRRARDLGRAGDSGRFRVVGQNPKSIALLSDSVREVQQRRFPFDGRGTTETTMYEYAISGDIPPLLRVPILNQFIRPQDYLERVEMSVGLLDYQGALAEGKDEQNKPLTAESIELRRNRGLWEHLGNSGGLVYLFDPQRRDNYNTLGPAIQLILQTMKDLTLLEHTATQLPQRLAICVTKYDIRSVFRGIREILRKSSTKRDFDIRSHDGMPVIEDEETAWNTFSTLAASNELVLEKLEEYFEPENVRIFFTSAIGFYRYGESRESARLRLDDCSNVIYTVGGPRLRSSPIPVNVIEPMLWAAGIDV